MSERLSGPARAEANAAASIEQRETAQAALDEAAMRDTATAENYEFDRNSEAVRAMNEAADVAIFGSRGHTEGYVGEDGQPLTKPIPGKLEEIRSNPRYGTKEADRQAAADGYLESIEELQAEGFELSQAKLIMDLREERQAREAKDRKAFIELFRNQGEHYPDRSEEDASEAAMNVARRIWARTVQSGYDETFLKRFIREENIFDREKYDQRRFKQGNPKRGERKKFTEYLNNYVNEFRDQEDVRSRRLIERDMLTKEQVRAQAKANREQAAREQAERERAERERVAREQAKKARAARSGNNPDKAPKPDAGERGEARKKGVTKVQYERDKDGHVRLGTEYSKPGYTFDWTENWAKGKDREIMIETEVETKHGKKLKKFYVKGDTLYDLDQSREFYDRGIGMPASWVPEGGTENPVIVSGNGTWGAAPVFVSQEGRETIPEDQREFPQVTIGERWKLAPDFMTGRVVSVTVGEGIAAESHLGEHGPIDANYEKRGKNPFEVAQYLLDRIEDQGDKIEADMPDGATWMREKFHDSVSAAKERMTERTRRMADPLMRAGRFTAEKLDDLTATVDYLGNIALIDAAYYAGTAADRAWDFSRWIDDTGNAALENAAVAMGLEAVPSAEKEEQAAKKTNFLGRIATSRMVSGGSRLASRARQRMSRSRREQVADDELDE